jgi:hypothetical protein
MFIATKRAAFGLCVLMAACSADQPKPLPLAKSGQPVIVTTDTDLPGHQLVTIGELRESNKKCSAQQMAIGALTEFPHADAVIGYQEHRGLCHTEIAAGGDYYFCEIVCQAQVVKFADGQASQ